MSKVTEKTSWKDVLSLSHHRSSSCSPKDFHRDPAIKLINTSKFKQPKKKKNNLKSCLSKNLLLDRQIVQLDSEGELQHRYEMLDLLPGKVMKRN